MSNVAPYIQSKRLFSDALGEMVCVKVTMHALKTIRKVCKRNLKATQVTGRWSGPICSQHKVGLAWLGRYASTCCGQRSAGTKDIRGILFSIWSSPAWYVSHSSDYG
jgi:hypothetical protein